MVECKPVPSSVPSSPETSDRLRNASASMVLPLPRSSFLGRNLLRRPLPTTKRRTMVEENVAVEDYEDESDLEETIIRKFVLYNACSRQNINLVAKKNRNTVRADAEAWSHYAQLTVKSIRPSEISIYNDRSQRYLCFTRHGKLMMRAVFRDKSCVFHEVNKKDVLVLQSSYNKTWFIGFGHDGRSLLGDDYTKKLAKNRGCYNFIKTGEHVYKAVMDVSRGPSRKDDHQLHRLSKAHFASTTKKKVQQESLPPPIPDIRLI